MDMDLNTNMDLLMDTDADWTSQGFEFLNRRPPRSQMPRFTNRDQLNLLFLKIHHVFFKIFCDPKFFLVGSGKKQTGILINNILPHLYWCCVYFIVWV